MSNIIRELDNEQMGRELPEFAPGDTVVVQVKVKEGTQSGPELGLHRAQDFPRRGCRACLPVL